MEGGLLSRERWAVAGGRKRHIKEGPGRDPVLVPRTAAEEDVSDLCVQEKLREPWL